MIPNDADSRKSAKCYAVYGWWRYYRTPDGETYSIRDGKYYFSHGNVITGENNEIKYIQGENLKNLLEKVRFED